MIEEYFIWFSLLKVGLLIPIQFTFCQFLANISSLSASCAFLVCAERNLFFMHSPDSVFGKLFYMSSTTIFQPVSNRGVHVFAFVLKHSRVRTWAYSEFDTRPLYKTGKVSNYTTPHYVYIVGWCSGENFFIYLLLIRLPKSSCSQWTWGCWSISLDTLTTRLKFKFGICLK